MYIYEYMYVYIYIYVLIYLFTIIYHIIIYLIIIYYYILSAGRLNTSAVGIIPGTIGVRTQVRAW